MAFKKGESGNPSGRKKGQIDRRSAWRAELGKELPAVIARLVELAKSGDLDAIRILLSRTCPPLRASGPTIELPALAKAGTPTARAEAVLAAVAAGRLSVDDAAALLAAIANAMKVAEIDDIDRRLRAVEEANGGTRAR